MTDELLDIVVKSPAFEESHTIPVKHTADGENVSPALTWSGVPHEARALVLTCEDPDARRGTFTHWLLYNLPPQTREVPEGASTFPAGTEQGTNDFGNPGYGGPSPPPGNAHRYYFKLTALRAPLSLPVGARREDVVKAMEGLVIAEGWLMGLYGRKEK